MDTHWWRYFARGYTDWKRWNWGDRWWWRIISSAEAEYKRCRKFIGNIEKPFSIYSKKGDQMQDLINKFETMLTRDKVEKCKQVKITSYFVKEK